MAKPKRIFETAFKTYTEVSAIGEGGSGNVFKVIDEDGIEYAIKLLASTKISPLKRKRFKNEINFCQNNTHPNIVTVSDHGLYNDSGTQCPFYVMDVYSGSLKSLMKSGIAPDKVLSYFGQILNGVEAAHLRGVIHRDLKPENVLYMAKDDRLAVADFGIAHFEEEQLITFVDTHKNGERLMNQMYAAPEQRDPQKAVDRRADIFALGLILNQLFTGEVPHGTNYKTIQSVAPDYAYLDLIVAQMISQSPSDRPDTIDDIKLTLQAQGRDFAERQKLSQLQDKVIPAIKSDDPLIVDPPKIIKSDYRSKRLIFVTQHEINELWQDLFHNPRGYSSPIMGIEPQYAYISGSEIAFNTQNLPFGSEISDSEAKAIKNATIEWVLQTNQRYSKEIEARLRRKEQELIEVKRKQIEEQERTIRLNKALQG